jgi:hypothetical protein
MKLNEISGGQNVWVIVTDEEYSDRIFLGIYSSKDLADKQLKLLQKHQKDSWLKGYNPRIAVAKLNHSIDKNYPFSFNLDEI